MYFLMICTSTKAGVTLPVAVCRDAELVKSAFKATIRELDRIAEKSGDAGIRLAARGQADSVRSHSERQAADE
ncbi:MAG: hypothetical protein KA419_07125 [Acidobacteria bacterium]|nr:hypothetical protein [Acidobacteriota bacterium]